jgi:hypothetical protein
MSKSKYFGTTSKFTVSPDMWRGCQRINQNAIHRPKNSPQPKRAIESASLSAACTLSAKEDHVGNVLRTINTFARRHFMLQKLWSGSAAPLATMTVARGVTIHEETFFTSHVSRRCIHCWECTAHKDMGDHDLRSQNQTISTALAPG